MDNGKNQTTSEYEIQIESLNAKIQELNKEMEQKNQKINELNQYIVKNITSNEKPKELKEQDSQSNRIENLRNELKDIYTKNKG